MASRRMIDPAIWQSESMAELTREQRLLFIGLFSNADDQGRLRGNANLIRSIVFPFDEDIPTEQIKSDLEAIAAQGCIVMYEIEGKEFIQVVHWWDYQSPQWAYPSKYPAPPGWNDRLRYRKDNRVIVCNWTPDHSDYTPIQETADGASPSQVSGDTPENTGDLPKALPKALGGSIALGLGLGLEIENKKELEAAAALAEVSTIYQNEIGPISPLIRDELLDLCETYPPDWIPLAIGAAVEQNVRKLSYIKGVLRDWKAVGGPQQSKPRSKYRSKDAKSTPPGPNRNGDTADPANNAAIHALLDRFESGELGADEARRQLAAFGYVL